MLSLSTKPIRVIGFGGSAQSPACTDSRYRVMVLERAGDRDKGDRGEVPSAYVTGDGDQVGE